MKKSSLIIASILCVVLLQFASSAQVVRDLLDPSGKSEAERQRLIEATLHLLNAQAAQDSHPRGKALGHEKQIEKEIEKLSKELHGSSSGIAKGDFNGDGFADLAIGVPFRDFSLSEDGGSVIVIYGSETGLTTTNPAVPAPQIFPVGSQAREHRGGALAAGDFNDDGFSDLAIGSPNKVVGCVDGICHNTVGTVRVFYGSGNGLALTPTAGVIAPQLFVDEDPGFVDDPPLQCEVQADCPSVSSAAAGFGFALAWGDFNGDGIGDLAVGNPFGTVLPGTSLAVKCGDVNVLFGSTSHGLTAASRQFLHPTILRDANQLEDIEELAEGIEAFGASLAAGDFTGDGITDLAVGAPLKDYGRDAFHSGVSDSGAVFVFNGSANQRVFNGVAAVLSKGAAITNRSEGVGGTPAVGDQFGSALTAGDFDGDGRADLAIGVPNESVGSHSHAGGVYVVYSRHINLSQFGLAAPGVGIPFRQHWTEDAIPGLSSQAGSGFGLALAAGDFNDDTKSDLAIGVPLKTLGGSAGDGAGVVDVIYGSASGLQVFTPGEVLPQQLRHSTVAAGEHFGTSLTGWNFGRDEFLTKGGRLIRIRTADLAVGIPGATVSGQSGAGAVEVFYGRALTVPRLQTTNSQVLTEASPGIGLTPRANDHFGAALY